MLLKLGKYHPVYSISDDADLTRQGRGEFAPRRLRMYANHSTIVDFAEAEDITPQLNISLLEGETGVTEYPLRTAAFANVSSLSLYFVSIV